MMRPIDTAQLRLEPQSVAHAAEMFEVLSDPAIYTYENAPPTSLEWLEQRFRKLETRQSADGSEQWLNWVIRLPSGALIGYVQATIHADNSAGIAYEMHSRYWGRGLGAIAARAMIGELATHYSVREFHAVAKATNFRSIRMLERLGFMPASAAVLAASPIETDEVMLTRRIETC